MDVQRVGECPSMKVSRELQEVRDEAKQVSGEEHLRQRERQVQRS